MLRFSENRRSSGLSVTSNARVSFSTHGLVEATQAQAEGGTVTGRFMSPLRVAQAISFQAPGIITAYNLGQFAATTSAQLRGVISDETGSGALVFGTSPTLSGPTISDAALTGTTTTQAVLGDGNGLSQPQWHLVADDGGRGANITATSYTGAGGTINGGGIFHGNHARGTVASPSHSLSGDITGGYGSRCWHSGGAFQTSSPASIHFVAAEDQLSTAFGMYLRFLTTPKTSTTRQERLIIADTGTVWGHDTATFDPRLDAQTIPFGAAASGQILASAGTNNAGVSAVGYNVNAGFRAAQSGGTPASPSATTSGTIISFLGGHGHDGSAFTNSAKALITLKASENFTGSAQGTTVGIECTQATTTTRTEVARFDKPTTATHTGLLLWDVDNGTLERVTVGAADSGGSGFKVLRIPN